MHANGAASVPLELVDRWWRAANYLTVGQIYLMRNALLERPLEPGDIKPRLLGHWGTSPGLSLVYAHLNRAIVERGTPMLYVCGPGLDFVERTLRESYRHDETIISLLTRADSASPVRTASIE